MREQTTNLLLKKIEIRPQTRKIISSYLFVASFVGFLFFAASFLPIYEAANTDLERHTFTLIEMAFGTHHFNLNGLFLSSLITSFLGSTLMLVIALLFVKEKSFLPLHTLLIGIDFLLFVYTFVIFLLNPLLASYTLSVFETFSSLWPIYVMSLLLFFIVTTIGGILIYLSVAASHVLEKSSKGEDV